MKFGETSLVLGYLVQGFIVFTCCSFTTFLSSVSPTSVILLTSLLQGRKSCQCYFHTAEETVPSLLPNTDGGGGRGWWWWEGLVEMYVVFKPIHASGVDPG